MKKNILELFVLGICLTLSGCDSSKNVHNSVYDNLYNVIGKFELESRNKLTITLNIGENSITTNPAFNDYYVCSYPKFYYKGKSSPEKNVPVLVYMPVFEDFREIPFGYISNYETLYLSQSGNKVAITTALGIFSYKVLEADDNHVSLLYLGNPWYNKYIESYLKTEEGKALKVKMDAKNRSWIEEKNE